MKLRKIQSEIASCPKAVEAAMEQHSGLDRYFNPEIDLNDEAFEICVRCLEKMKAENKWEDYCRAVRCIMELFPEQTRDMRFTRDVYERIIELYYSATVYSQVEVVIAIVNMFPELDFSEFVGEDLFRYAENFMQEMRDSSLSMKWSTIVCEMAKVLIIFPDRKSELGINEEVYHEIAVYMKKNPNFINTHRHYMMILFPEHADEFCLSDENIEHLRGVVDEMRAEEHLGYPYYLWMLASSAVEEIRIEGYQRKLIFKSQDIGGAESLPVRSAVI